MIGHSCSWLAAMPYSRPTFAALSATAWILFDPIVTTGAVQTIVTPLPALII